MNFWVLKQWKLLYRLRLLSSAIHSLHLFLFHHRIVPNLRKASAFEFPKIQHVLSFLIDYHSLEGRPALSQIDTWWELPAETGRQFPAICPSGQPQPVDEVEHYPSHNQTDRGRDGHNLDYCPTVCGHINDLKTPSLTIFHMFSMGDERLLCSNIGDLFGKNFVALFTCFGQ